MRFTRKPKKYRIRKKFILWPRRLYTTDILTREYKVTIWLEEVTWTKTKYFPLILLDDVWYTAMSVGTDIYK